MVIAEINFLNCFPDSELLMVTKDKLLNSDYMVDSTLVHLPLETLCDCTWASDRQTLLTTMPWSYVSAVTHKKGDLRSKNRGYR